MRKIQSVPVLETLNLKERLIDSIESFGNYTLMLKEMLVMLLKLRIHWRNTLHQMAFIGTDSLPIVLVTAFAVGMVFCLQTSNVMIRFGAVSIVGGATALSLVRELTPVFTAVVLAGRVGAAITAEIGSMKVTEQIDALIAMAVPPVYYLVIPRTLSALIMIPLLTIIALAVGLIGGLIVAVLVQGIIWTVFIDSVKSMLWMKDVVKALIKASVFGFIIATIACYQGINTDKGAQGVGLATTNSVVASLIAIFISNYFLSFFLYTVLK